MNEKGIMMGMTDTVACFESHMGVYAMEWHALRIAESLVKSGAYKENPRAERPQAQKQGTIAVIPVHGNITKKRGKFTGASCVETRAMLREVADDPSVSKVILHIHSPGGHVEGVDDLALEVNRAKQKKEVVGYIEDLGASAAYWIASQCSSIAANASAFVGSCGVFGVAYDQSGAYERMGVKVHLISSGGVKGQGAAGMPITEDFLTEEQRLVDSIAKQFKSRISSGRGMSEEAVDKIFTGQLWHADEALELKLIDKITDFDSLLAESVSAQSGQTSMEAAMPTEEKAGSQTEEVSLEVSLKAAEDKEPMEDEEEEDEEKEEEDAKAEISSAELRRDAEALATSLKEAGSPFSLDSLISKLSKVTSLSEQLAVYGALAKIPPASKVSGFEAKQPTASKEPSQRTRSDLALEWDAVYEKHIKAGKSAMQALTDAKAEAPELHKAYLDSYKRS